MRFNEVVTARAVNSFRAFVDLVQQQPLRYYFLF
jgi:hypothetical protein